MPRTTKRFLAAAAVATAMVTTAAVPAGAEVGVAMANCQVKPLFSVIEYRQTVLIYGFYNAPAGAVDVKLTCGVTRNGVTYGTVTDSMVGPAAVVAGTGGAPVGTVGSCHEILVTYLDGSTTYSDTCP